MSAFSDDLRDFAFDLTRSRARLMQSGIPDSPTRTGCPECEVERPDFMALPLSRQLDALDIACRRALYRSALIEALPESDLYEPWLAKLIDSGVSDAEIGRMARQMIVAYMDSVAQAHDENLTEFAA